MFAVYFIYIWTRNLQQMRTFRWSLLILWNVRYFLFFSLFVIVAWIWANLGLQNSTNLSLYYNWEIEGHIWTRRNGKTFHLRLYNNHFSLDFQAFASTEIFKLSVNQLNEIPPIAIRYKIAFWKIYLSILICNGTPTDVDIVERLKRIELYYRQT